MLTRILIVFSILSFAPAATANPEVANTPLYKLALHANTLTPQQTKQLVHLVSPEEHLIWEAMGKNFKTLVMLYVCRIDSQLVWAHQGQAQNCVIAAQAWQHAVQWSAQLKQHGLDGSPIQLAERGRQDLLFFYRCSNGILERSTCQSSMAMQQKYYNMMNATNQRIIENIGNKCRVGIDPNCVP